ncbi:amino acid transporter [Stenotrophomonas sp. NA06056]|uniref:amino acid transporter n=1 Tax=Stenotrophomonas sp. NA06056 TaxID=2742129 RepID=UPI0020CB5219|nr:amino acid transporter [Stenotrophomonas sp. NA06056]
MIGDNGGALQGGAKTGGLGTDHLLVAALTLLMGGSVVALVGQHTAAQAGPAIVLSLLLAALGTLPMLYCLRMAMRSVPDPSGLHGLLRAAWGKPLADVLVIALLLELTATTAGLAQSMANHLYAAAEAVDVAPAQWMPLPLAASIMVLLLGAATAVLRTPYALLLASALLTVKLGVGLLLVLLAARHVHYAYWIPWLPSATAPYRFGLGGVLAAGVAVLGVLLGAGLLAGFAGRLPRPRPQVSHAAGAAVLMAMLCLMVVAALQSGLIEFAALASTRPLSVALQGVPQLQWLLPLLPLAGGAGLAALQMVLLLLAARMGLEVWPPASGDAGAHARLLVTIALTVLAAALAFSLPDGWLPQLPGPAGLLVLAAVCLGVARSQWQARAAGEEWRLVPMLLPPVATALCLLPAVTSRLFVPLLVVLMVVLAGMFLHRRAGRSR